MILNDFLRNHSTLKIMVTALFNNHGLFMLWYMTLLSVMWPYFLRNVEKSQHKEIQGYTVGALGLGENTVEAAGLL